MKRALYCSKRDQRLDNCCRVFPILHLREKNPISFKRAPYAMKKEPCILWKEPCIPWKEPYIRWKETCAWRFAAVSFPISTSSEQIWYPWKEPYIPWKKSPLFYGKSAMFHEKRPALGEMLSCLSRSPLLRPAWQHAKHVKRDRKVCQKRPVYRYIYVCIYISLYTYVYICI